MDWKDHIVAGEGCSAAAAEFAAYANEGFLVTLANKGLYKRAVKDCPSVERCALERSETGLTVTLDDIQVKLSRNLAQSVCSCPSKTICKHILMAVLCAAEFAASQLEQAPASPQPQQEELPGQDVKKQEAEGQETEGPETERQETGPEAKQEQKSIGKETGTAGQKEPQNGEPFAQLKQVDLTALRKKAGKKQFEEALHLVQEGWTAQFTEGELLSAEINTDQMTVFFPKEESIARAVCKCGEPGLCRHKLVAILSYLTQNHLMEAGGRQEELSLLSEAQIRLLKAADEFVITLLEKGIVSANGNDVETAIQLSIKLDAQGIGNLSRLLRSLSADLENMLSKNAAYSQMTVYSLLSRLHNTMSLLLKSPQDSKLVSALTEGSRSEYYLTPSGTFLGLGAYPWQTRSGYFGLTALLYHQEKQCVCTYTVSMADFYENTAGYSNLHHLQNQMMKGGHWELELSLNAICSSQMVLKNYKSNLQNRLSSSKQTGVRLMGKTSFEQVKELPIARELGELPIGAPDQYEYFSKKRPEEVIAVRTTALREIQYDRAEQVLYFTLANEEGKGVPGKLPFSELQEPAIRYIERLGKLERFSERYFICMRRRGKLVPVSMVTQDGVENFYLY